MLSHPGRPLKMGSPETEAERGKDEGPVLDVTISPFWMAKTEITWDAYDIWMSDLEVFNRDVNKIPPGTRDNLADQYQKSQPPNHIAICLLAWDSRLPGNLHDSACRSHLLQMAFG